MCDCYYDYENARKLFKHCDYYKDEYNDIKVEMEELYDNQRAYKGSIKNNGLKRADFVRVVYTLHDENSNLIAIDSIFIEGTKKIFNSGLISDASINPGDFATFYVTIETTDEQEVKYFLRDIRWEYFE